MLVYLCLIIIQFRLDITNYKICQYKSDFTLKYINSIRITDEIKFLYLKKMIGLFTLPKTYIFNILFYVIYVFFIIFVNKIEDICVFL